MTVSEDRWTCPDCQRTTVVIGSEQDTRSALDAVRKRHGKGHTGHDPGHGSEVIARLGLPDPIPTARRGRT